MRRWIVASSNEGKMNIPLTGVVTVVWDLSPISGTDKARQLGMCSQMKAELLEI